MAKPVIIESYNPRWPIDFSDLQSVYQAHLSQYLTSIEHIGSTSIEGLPAKPIIDIDLVLASSAALPAVIGILEKLGYTYEGDKGIPGREAFRQRSVQTPSDGSGRVWPEHHLYVCSRENLSLWQHLTFRDYLRQHPETVAAYAALKQDLAIRFRNDRVAYTDNKTGFILAILKIAK